MNKYHKNKERIKSDINKSVLYFGKFVFWSLIYALLYLLFGVILKDIFGNQHFFQVKIIYILIMGLCLSISSRIIYSLINKKRIYMDSGVFFFWTFAYGLSMGLFEYIRDFLIRKFQLQIFSNYYFGLIFVGIGIWMGIKLVQQMDFNLLSNRRITAPSQIFTGIVLLVMGILCWRFSAMVFLDWLGWAEGVAWSWLIGFGLIIAGFLVLLAWWRNNVLQHRFGLKIGHWN